tara:strand:- start:381 stop:563 length:183 start_codon:yes stop_codon:yes gene_type:complete
MKIENIKQSYSALDEIKSWLQDGVFNDDSYTEITSVIEAVEDYMGMPLPAKKFIESNCRA